MKAEQLYYTSCEEGLENASGFQIKAMSDGFTKTNDVRQLGSYEQARDLPSQPNEEELKDFPILFKYKDNIFVRSVYVGQDYTQRFGNYFMHTLEVNKIDVYPIDLYFWNGWVNNEEKVDNLTLNSIEIDKINPQVFTLDNEELLSNLIGALFLKDKQIVIKISNQVDGIKLLNFMQKAFPLNIAKNITFSTYQFSYTDCLDINLVIGDTEWEHIDKSGFHFFDLTKDLYPEINNNKYSHFIVEFLNNPTRLEEFYSFFDSFNIDKLDNNLNFVLEIFLFTKFNYKIDNLGDVLTFISSHMKKECINDFLKELEQSIGNIETMSELDALLSFSIDMFPNKVFTNMNEIVTNFFKKVQKDEIYIDENEFYLLVKKLKEYKKVTKSDVDFQNIVITHIQQKKRIDFKIITLFEVQQQRDLIARMSNILLDDELKKLAHFFLSYYESENYFITVRSLMDRGEEVNKDFKVLLFEEKLKNINNREEFLTNYRTKVGNYPEIYYKFLNEEEKISQIKKWSKTIEEYEKYPFFNDIWQQINESLFDSFLYSKELHSLFLEKYNHIKLKKANNFLLRKVLEDYELIDKQLLVEIKALNKEDYNRFLTYFFHILDSSKSKSIDFLYLFHPTYKELFLHHFFKEKTSLILDFYLNGLGDIEKDVENHLINNKKELLLVNKKELSPLKQEKLNELLKKEKKQSSMNFITRFVSNFKRKD